MRFLVDANLSPQVADWLRGQGHDAIHVAERGLIAASDQAIFTTAARERRVLLTTDLDFGEILAHSKGRVSTVIFRLSGAAPPKIIARLEKVLVEAGAPLERGAVVLVERARLRVRRLPLGS